MPKDKPSTLPLVQSSLYGFRAESEEQMRVAIGKAVMNPTNRAKEGIRATRILEYILKAPAKEVIAKEHLWELEAYVQHMANPHIFSPKNEQENELQKKCEAILDSPEHSHGHTFGAVFDRGKSYNYSTHREAGTLRKVLGERILAAENLIDTLAGATEKEKSSDKTTPTSHAIADSPTELSTRMKKAVEANAIPSAATAPVSRGIADTPTTPALNPTQSRGELSRTSSASSISSFDNPGELLSSPRELGSPTSNPSLSRTDSVSSLGDAGDPSSIPGSPRTVVEAVDLANPSEPKSPRTPHKLDDIEPSLRRPTQKLGKEHFDVVYAPADDRTLSRTDSVSLLGDAGNPSSTPGSPRTSRTSEDIRTNLRADDPSQTSQPLNSPHNRIKKEFTQQLSAPGEAPVLSEEVISRAEELIGKLTSPVPQTAPKRTIIGTFSEPDIPLPSKSKAITSAEEPKSILAPTLTSPRRGGIRGR